MGYSRRRVLHIVEILNRGAIENRFVRMFGSGIENGITMDLTSYCVVGAEGLLDGVVRKLCAGIVYSPLPIARTRRYFAVRVPLGLKWRKTAVALGE